MQDHEFQVARLGHTRVDRMVGRLPFRGDQTDPAPGIGGRLTQDGEEILRSKMIRAGRGQENPSRREESQGAKVDLFIASPGLGNAARGLGEGRRIEHHHIDGVLFESMNPPYTMHAAIISRLKIMAGIDKEWNGEAWLAEGALIALWPHWTCQPLRTLRAGSSRIPSWSDGTDWSGCALWTR